MKKLILTLGSVAAVVTPIVCVVSCTRVGADGSKTPNATLTNDVYTEQTKLIVGAIDKIAKKLESNLEQMKGGHNG